MANKKSSKKKTKQPAGASAQAQPADQKKSSAKKQDVVDVKAEKAKLEKAKAKKAKKKANAKPGVFARMKSYLGSVRSEMRRVVWPNKKELLNYSVAVIVSLIVVGVVIAVLDALIGEGLILFSGLRG